MPNKRVVKRVVAISKISSHFMYFQ